MGCLCPNGEQERQERNEGQQRVALYVQPQVATRTDYKVQNNYVYNTVQRRNSYEDYQRGYVHGYQQATVSNQLAVQGQQKKQKKNSVHITNNIEQLTINVVNQKNTKKAIQRQLSAQNLSTQQSIGNVKVTNNIKKLNVNLINKDERKPPAIAIKPEQKPKQTKEQNAYYKNLRLQNQANGNQHFRNKSQQPKQSNQQNQRKPRNQNRKASQEQQYSNPPREFYDDYD